MLKMGQRPGRNLNWNKDAFRRLWWLSPDKEGHQFGPRVSCNGVRRIPLSERERDKQKKVNRTVRKKNSRHTPIDLLGHHSVNLFLHTWPKKPILEGVFFNCMFFTIKILDQIVFHSKNVFIHFEEKLYTCNHSILDYREIRWHRWVMKSDKRD